jgi:hypothetical protein
MKNQSPAQIAGVREKCKPGVGATPVRCTYRVGSAALVAPTPGPGTDQLWTEPST